MAYAFEVWTGSAGAKPQQQQHSQIIAYFKSYRNDSSISVLEPPKINFCSSLSLANRDGWRGYWLKVSHEREQYSFGSHFRHIFVDLIDKSMIAWPNDNCPMDFDKS